MATIRYSVRQNHLPGRRGRHAAMVRPALTGLRASAADSTAIWVGRPDGPFTVAAATAEVDLSPWESRLQVAHLAAKGSLPLNKR